MCPAAWTACTRAQRARTKGITQTPGIRRGRQWKAHASKRTSHAIWTVKPWIVPRGGCGHFFVGDYSQDSLAVSGAAADANWLYAQATLSF